MSGNNGVIRIERKGKKKFAFGDSAAFEVDVVTQFQRWIEIDDGFRPEEPDQDGNRPIHNSDLPAYHLAAVEFAKSLSGEEINVAEALDFIARLRECYDDLVDFFHPKSREERASPDSSEAELRFSVEGS